MRKSIMSLSMFDLNSSSSSSCVKSLWKEIQPGMWRSVLSSKVWTLRQNEDEILYQVYEDSSSSLEDSEKEEILEEQKPEKDRQKEDHIVTGKNSKSNHTRNNSKQENVAITNIEEEKIGDGISTDAMFSSILKDYFQLNISLEKLYKTFKAADANFTKVCPGFPGVRVLRQDPTENLFSFICSSNNNISRITGMVETLCSTYGEEIAILDDRPWHAFPSVSALARDGIEQELREKGFGYRAKFINQTAKYIKAQPEGWLEGLRQLAYEEAHAELMKLPGVGAKVADCVCLMSMDKMDAIPVDTHVWQIASRDYMPSLNKTKSLTDKVYKEIGAFFRELFGEYAGWAHSVLFSADLKKFQQKAAGVNSPEKKQSKRQDYGDAKRVKKEKTGAKKIKRKR
ncbi:N-glycosylase/DNA lyase-like isoform X2 [Acanthaster planci]|uniref:N-glycosylase/DNA lyase n=1 Tax=Acanthaster planci TaxID=133434 RepID=A0A8B7XYQ5_ACAPL|nr:N-glycosylase/DNA lyase-like isoform X2 [Acanthaster planci]